MIINQFKNKYSWLSNMCIIKPFVFDGITYNTVENFYQACKVKDNLGIKLHIAGLNPYDSKKYGRNVLLRSDWEKIKDQIMQHALNIKFSQSEFKNHLVNTGLAELVEGNYHNDKYWGFCLKTNQGQNKLGNMIMTIRAKIYNDLMSEDLSIDLYPTIKQFLDKYLVIENHHESVIRFLQNSYLTTHNINYIKLEEELKSKTEVELISLLNNNFDEVPVSKNLIDFIGSYNDYVESNKFIKVF